MVKTKSNVGKISQVIGPVVEIEFPGEPPAVYNALTIEREGGKPLVLEVQGHIGGGAVRALAM